jgi:hypothetical protein
MKLLLTSSGINDPSIHKALVDLLGRPVDESNALFVPTGIYPFAGGTAMAYKAVCGLGRRSAVPELLDEPVGPDRSFEIDAKTARVCRSQRRNVDTMYQLWASRKYAGFATGSRRGCGRA